MTNIKSVREISIAGYLLSVTTRFVNEGDTPELLEELTFRTIGAFLHIAKLIEAGSVQVGIEGSIESRLAAERSITIPESFTDSRITVWDVYRGSKRVEFILNSDDNLQGALNAHMANENGSNRAIEKYGGTPQNAVISQNIATSGASTAQTGATVHESVNGIISATRAPNPKETLYADGQAVAFNVTRVSVGANKGSATYALWGTLGGGKYPLMTIYKCKPNSDENSPGYIAIKDSIVAMDLSLDKPEVHGKWELVCRAAHKDGKEYLNPVSLEAL